MKSLIPFLSALTATAALAAGASPDSSFYKKLAEGGIAEVEAGKLAQSKAADSQIKDFGAMMVKDHTAANEKLQALATSKGIDLPKSSSMGQIASRGKLELLSGASFDKSYLKDQLAAHRDTVKLLEQEIASGQDPDAKAFAQQVLPTERAHLTAVTKLAASPAG